MWTVNGDVCLASRLGRSTPQIETVRQLYTRELTVFRDVTPCTLAYIYQYFEGRRDRDDRGVLFADMFERICQTARRHAP